MELAFSSPQKHLAVFTTLAWPFILIAFCLVSFRGLHGQESPKSGAWQNEPDSLDPLSVMG